MTRKQDEQNYIEALASDTESTVRFLHSEIKPDRERATCVAFLRCLGVTFTVGDVLSYEKDPPDVIFRSAKFEVCELLGDRLMPVITQALKNKLYDPDTYASLDALVYIGLKDACLDLETIVPDVAELFAQGWRSVSILMPNQAVVLWADAAAPDFLYERCGLVKSEWKKPEGLFDM